MAINYNIKNKKNSSTSWALPLTLLVAVGYIFKDILFVENVSVLPNKLPTGQEDVIPVNTTQKITDLDREMSFITKTSVKAYQDTLSSNDVD